MGHGPEENWTDIGKLAYKIYVKKMHDMPGVDEYASDWWFHDYPEQFEEEYKEAKIQLRNKKIKKILNENR